jgi:hypothetical protein
MISSLFIGKVRPKEAAKLGSRAEPEAECGGEDEASAVLPSTLILIDERSDRIVIGETIYR